MIRVQREDFDPGRELAALTLRRLPDPPGSGPRGYGSSWPEYVRDARHAYGYHEARMRVVPSPAEIARMEDCLDWLRLVGPEDAVRAMTVGARRHVGDVLRQILTMHAGGVGLGDAGVALRAGRRHARPRQVGRLHVVAAVTVDAHRRGPIAARHRFGVDAVQGAAVIVEVTAPARLRCPQRELARRGVRLRPMRILA